MPPSSPSSLNPFAASFIPPNISLLQSHASSSACDVASLTSLFSPLNSSNLSSFSLEHLVLAVISAFAHGVRCSTISTPIPQIVPEAPKPHSSPESASSSSLPLCPSPIPIPVPFSALQGVSKSAVSGLPLIASALNTVNTNTATLRASPSPAQSQSSSPSSSSSSSDSWQSVSPKRHRLRPHKPAVSPTLNTISKSKSIPLTNSFAALASDCDEPESNNATLPLPLPLPVPATVTATVPTQTVQPDRPSPSITLNTNCSNALVEKKDNSAAQTSHVSSSSPSSSSSSPSSVSFSYSSSSSYEYRLLSSDMVSAIFTPKNPREWWEGPRYCDVLAACTDPTLQKDHDSIHNEILKVLDFESTKRLTRAQKDKLCKEQSLLRIARDTIHEEIARRKLH